MAETRDLMEALTESLRKAKEDRRSKADERWVMEAQTYSRCLTCGETIEPGDDIVHCSLDDAWVHGECA